MVTNSLRGLAARVLASKSDGEDVGEDGVINEAITEQKRKSAQKEAKDTLQFTSRALAISYHSGLFSSSQI